MASTLTVSSTRWAPASVASVPGTEASLAEADQVLDTVSADAILQTA